MEESNSGGNSIEEDDMKNSEEEIGGFEGTGLILVSTRNKNKHIFSHYPYGKTDSDFESGFFSYIWTHFSIATAVELWPPTNEYEMKRTYSILDDGTKILEWNHFWEKFEIEKRSPWKFYNSLDYGNKAVLYSWYKKNVKT